MKNNPRSIKSESERQVAWGKLGTVAVACAALIIAVVLVLTPKPVDDPALIEELKARTEGRIPKDAGRELPPATLRLADTPVEITDKKLQERLTQIAEDVVAELPEDTAALHVAAMIFSELQKTKVAEELWQRCLERKPTQPGPYVGFAELLVKLGRPEDANKLLEENNSQFTASPVFALSRARVLDQLGEAEQALSLLDACLKSHPEQGESWVQLGQLQIEVGQFEAAESSLRTAVALGFTNSTVIFALSNAVARQGKKEEAAQLRDAYSKLRAEADPSGNRFQETYSSALHGIAVRALLNVSSMYLEHGNLPKAEKVILELLALDPHHVSAHMTLSTILRKTGRIPDALIVHERLMRLEPDNPLNAINLASVTLEIGDFEKAENVLKEAAKKAAPRSGLLHAELARMYMTVGRLVEAKVYAKQATEREPNRGYYGMLVNICKELGDSGGVFDALEGMRRVEAQTPTGSKQ